MFFSHVVHSDTYALTMPHQFSQLTLFRCSGAKNVKRPQYVQEEAEKQDDEDQHDHHHHRDNSHNYDDGGEHSSCSEEEEDGTFDKIVLVVSPIEASSNMVVTMAPLSPCTSSESSSMLSSRSLHSR